jgi:hypothetical protein
LVRDVDQTPSEFFLLLSLSGTVAFKAQRLVQVGLITEVHEPSAFSSASPSRSSSPVRPRNTPAIPIGELVTSPDWELNLKGPTLGNVAGLSYLWNFENQLFLAACVNPLDEVTFTLIRSPFHHVRVEIFRYVTHWLTFVESQSGTPSWMEELFHESATHGAFLNPPLAPQVFIVRVPGLPFMAKPQHEHRRTLQGQTLVSCLIPM